MRRWPSSGLSEAEVERMRKEAELHAEEDRRRKELIESRNTADSSVYAAEKVLREMGEKVPAELKSKVEEQVAKVRQAMNSDNAENIRKETDALNQVVQQIGVAAYQQAGPAAGEAPDSQAPKPDSGGEDVVDGEFRNL